MKFAAVRGSMRAPQVAPRQSTLALPFIGRLVVTSFSKTTNAVHFLVNDKAHFHEPEIGVV